MYMFFAMQTAKFSGLIRAGLFQKPERIPACGGTSVLCGRGGYKLHHSTGPEHDMWWQRVSTGLSAGATVHRVPTG